VVHPPHRGLVAFVVACWALLALGATASAKEVLYGSNGAGGNPSNLYILNPSSGGVVETVGPIGFAVTGLAVDPADGTLYGSTAQKTGPGAPNPGSLIRIDRTTGAGTLIGDIRPDADGAADITFTPDGALFGWLQPGASDLVAIDKVSGAGSIVGDSGLNAEGSGLASSPAGVLFFAESADNRALDTVNRTTGLATEVATMNGTLGFRIAAFAFDGAGTLFGARQEGSPFFSADLITVDTTTGAVASRGASVSRLDALTFAKSTRTLTFDASRVKAKKKKKAASVSRLVVTTGRKARLSGDLSAPQDVTGCESNQTVELQRRKPKQTAFRTFAQVRTDVTGKFSIKKKIKKTFVYQAVVGETAGCYDSTSNTEKVRAKKKKTK
jgi:hypothetical protein